MINNAMNNRFGLTWVDQSKPPIHGEITVTPEQADDIGRNISLLSNVVNRVLDSVGTTYTPPLVVGLVQYDTPPTEIDSLPSHIDTSGQKVVEVPIRPGGSRYIMASWLRHNGGTN